MSLDLSSIVSQLSVGGVFVRTFNKDTGEITVAQTSSARLSLEAPEGAEASDGKTMALHLSTRTYPSENVSSLYVRWPAEQDILTLNERAVLIDDVAEQVNVQLFLLNAPVRVSDAVVTETRHAGEEKGYELLTIAQSVPISVFEKLYEGQRDLPMYVQRVNEPGP